MNVGKGSSLGAGKYRIRTTELLLAMLGVVVLGVLVLIISIFGLDQREDRLIQIQPLSSEKEQDREAYLTLEPDSELLADGNQEAFHVLAHPGNREVDGIDVVLNFDPDKVMIKKVEYGTGFDTYAVDAGLEGELKISAWLRDIAGSISSSVVVATVFYELNEPSADISLRCELGETNDTNIVRFGLDLVDCQKNSGLTLSTTTVARKVVSEEIFVQEALPVSSDFVADSLSLIMPAVWSSGFVTAGCEEVTPPRPTGLTAVTGDNLGEVVLRWNKVEKVPVTHYAVTYGEKWLDFDYGASNIGDTDAFVVTGLKPGTGYYFVVTAVNKCASSGYSDGAANYAGGSVVTPKVSKPESTSAEEKGFEWEYQETNQGKGGDIADQEREDEPAETDSEDDDSVVYVPETETKDPWITGYLPWIGGGLLLVLLGFLVILLAKKRSAKNPEPERGSDVQPPEEF